MAHPDDEVIFLSQAFRFKPYIICLTCANNKIRSAEFNDLLKSVQCDGIIHDFRDSQEGWHNYEISRIRKVLNKSISQDEIIFTHNLDGEYGHPQHIMTAKIVREISRNVLSPRLGAPDEDTVKTRINLLEHYKSQQHILDLDLIRNWIKHSTIE